MSTGFEGPFYLTRVIPITPRGFFLQWGFRSAKESGNYTFQVFRSGSAEGPWESISGVLTNQYSYVDSLVLPDGQTTDTYRRPNQLSLPRRFFYRVVTVTPSGTNYCVVDDTDPDLDPMHAQQWRRATFDFNLSMRRQGIPVVVLKRRRWGVRCTRCTDAKTKEIVRAACVTCWGTMFEGGYWAPMMVWGRRGVAQESTTNSPEQKSDASVTRIWLPYIPQVEKDDVLVFPRDNKRVLVDQQLQTEIGTVTVHQVVTAVEISHDHVLYRYPVDTKDLKPLV